MAMNPQAMCEAIQKEYKTVTDSVNWQNGERPSKTAYTEAFDKGLTEYVEKNMRIKYAWAATMPPPASTPDPTILFSSELKISDKTIGQPSSVSAWDAMIMGCFLKATTIHESPFSTIEPGSLLAVSPLVIAPPPGEYPVPLLGICTQIYAWLLSAINPKPLAGTHGPYTGATTGMVIA